ncbi:hypothetical protein DACRYDRAFT_21099 [Dacryopinax primogenitus]|uniref:Uncharacterized protein n=1 Tax=Dacryopinax primogenitus (strain DJM 731) TaxID=1858805 RepID=M5G4C4_DACPD|nr:uncharacterized protein DACRYDRAFT_21099 [Dacryopinax primogenitus]EJU03544.1 hypothetical protein DACRYDRAFT_21099 [Dacryopinax primogenitus]
MMAASSPSRAEYSPLFTQGLYSANPASRRHLEAAASSSFLDVDSPSESGDDTDASMASFVGVLRPNSQAGRAVSPTPTVRPITGLSRPVHSRHAYIPPPAPAPNHALPSPPPSAPYGASPGRGAPVPGHVRSPTGASFGPSPADARTAALARLEGRPGPPAQQRPPQLPQPNGYGQPPIGSSFLNLSDPPQGRSRVPPPRRG